MRASLSHPKRCDTRCSICPASSTRKRRGSTSPPSRPSGSTLTPTPTAASAIAAAFTAANLITGGWFPPSRWCEKSGGAASRLAQQFCDERRDIGRAARTLAPLAAQNRLKIVICRLKVVVDQHIVILHP